MCEVMANILQNGYNKHDVKFRALYAYYFLGLSKTQLSKTYDKSVADITNWITHYEDRRSVRRPKTTPFPSKSNEEKRRWLLNLYHENPILYLAEVKTQFKDQFNIRISTSYICQILHENNMSWETLEMRALQIKDMEIVKFMNELNAFDWNYINLVFLDEVSMDDQGLIPIKGHGIIDEKLVYRGDVTRKPQSSMLAFLGQNGILDVYGTKGTFNRLTFIQYCKDFALGGICQQYPGRNSVWLLDDAKIHCHPNIIYYLRSLGILPIFLPMYTPFFNPLEYVFGVIQKNVKTNLAAGRNNVELLVNEQFTRMGNFPCTNIFKKCGYVMSGKFDPRVAYEQNANYLFK